MTKFPSLIEYIDSLGLDELHKAHKEEMENEDPSEQITFSEYVEASYEMAREMWEEQMNDSPKSIAVPFDAEKDIALGSAIEVMKNIINKGLGRGEVAQIVVADDLAPDYTSAVCIVDEFRENVVPAIEKALNELGA